MASSSACVPAAVAPSSAPVVPRAVIVSASEPGTGVLPAEGKRFPFRRESRLLTPAQFDQVFAGRKMLRGARFALHYRASDGSGPRLGLVIPRKQAPTAAMRNAIKRQAREAFRLQRASLPAYDLVLRLTSRQEKGPAGLALRKSWRAEIDALFDQLRHKVDG